MADQSFLIIMENSADVPERLIPGTLAWDLYQVEHKQRYVWASDHCKEKRVLDVACGTGYGSAILAQRGAAQVVGVDISVEAIASNGKLPSQLTLANGDACNLPFKDNAFDVVVSFETIEHLASPEALLIEISRVVKPGGLCICSSPNRDFQPSSGTKGTNPFHISEMTYAEFDELFGKHFDICDRFSQTHSEAYRRHLDILRAFDERLRPIRFSRLLRMEAKLRSLLRRDSLDLQGSLSPLLQRAVPGDYVIEPLNGASTDLLTFIFVGKSKHSKHK
jgi:ubiquinone/menaquinone biosynthesis C-methylase UbiE